MQVRIVADPDWMPELEAHLPGEVSRGKGVGSTDGSVILVVPNERAAQVLHALDGGIPAPVVWVVPKAARRTELERLSSASRGSQFVFEEHPTGVAEAVQSLIAEAEAAERRDAQAERAKASMQALWQQFQGTMVERLGTLEVVGGDLLEGEVENEALREAHHAAHKLHGSLGTFGLHRGSELAAELEALIEGALESEAMDPGNRYRYSELVVGLRREIEAGRPEDRSGAPTGMVDPDRAAGTVLIVEADADRLEKLGAAAVSRGWRPERAETAKAALERLEEIDRPQLAILHPPGSDTETLEALLSALAEDPDPVPVVFQGRSRSLDERLQAVTLGARVFVDRDASAEALMGRAESLLAEAAPGEARVLAVDDDPAVLRVLTFILRGAGFGVRTLDSPLEFWHTLEAVEPDLLLLDVEMPEVNGYQLCRAVRADPRWADLPVFFLTARSNPSDIIAGFEAGGDDFVVKPVAGPELLARVENRLARLGQPTQDPVDRDTGLATRSAAEQRLTTQLALATRYDDVVTVAMIRLAPTSEEPVDEHLTELSQNLHGDARPEDIVARWGKHELLVARYGDEAAETHRWLDRFVPSGAVQISMGLATFPDDAPAGSLVERAVADLEGQESRGRPGATPAPGAPDQVDADIVVVEDDVALGTLLTQTLDERGYNTHWIQDGAEAAELLTGEDPSLRASLIILDVGLPGMDGLTLLRQLARDKITRRTRVLMLTARAAESEVVKALELGAFDHVPKPFSVSELIHRVRRALGEKGGR